MGYSPWGHKESDTTERLHDNHLLKQLNVNNWPIISKLKKVML